jgi:thiamine pyrophosphokinase
MDKETVILANGKFPEHPIPLSYLKRASLVVCCDGAAQNLIEFGIEPAAIVGDIDSLDEKISSRFADRLYSDSDQETNDLTKAVHWCLERKLDDIIILGATGLREDHTIGNISLLADYSKLLKIKMVTDTGELVTLLSSSRLDAFPGQQISIFSIDPSSEITSEGLKYPLKKMKVSNWWMATLNESTGSTFLLSFEVGPLIVYKLFPEWD